MSNYHQPKKRPAPPPPPPPAPDIDDSPTPSPPARPLPDAFQEDGIGGGLLLHQPSASGTGGAKNINGTSSSIGTGTGDQQPQEVSTGRISSSSSSLASSLNTAKQRQGQNDATSTGAARHDNKAEESSSASVGGVSGVITNTTSRSSSDSIAAAAPQPPTTTFPSKCTTAQKAHEVESNNENANTSVVNASSAATRTDEYTNDDAADALFSDNLFLFDSLDDVVATHTATSDILCHHPDPIHMIDPRSMIVSPITSSGDDNSSNNNNTVTGTDNGIDDGTAAAAAAYDPNPGTFEDEFAFLDENKTPFPWSPIKAASSPSATTGTGTPTPTTGTGTSTTTISVAPPPSPKRYVSNVALEFQNDGGDCKIIDLHHDIRMIVPSVVGSVGCGAEGAADNNGTPLSVTSSLSASGGSGSESVLVLVLGICMYCLYYLCSIPMMHDAFTYYYVQQYIPQN